MGREGEGPFLDDLRGQWNILGDNKIPRGADLADGGVGHIKPRPYHDAGREGAIGKTQGAVGDQNERGLRPFGRSEEDLLDRSGRAVGIKQYFQGDLLGAKGERENLWRTDAGDRRLDDFLRSFFRSPYTKK